MRMCYAFRRGTFYPFDAKEGWQVPTGKTRAKYLRRVQRFKAPRNRHYGPDMVGLSICCLTDMQIHDNGNKNKDQQN